AVDASGAYSLCVAGARSKTQTIEYLLHLLVREELSQLGRHNDNGLGDRCRGGARRRPNGNACRARDQDGRQRKRRCRDAHGVTPIETGRNDRWWTLPPWESLRTRQSAGCGFYEAYMTQITFFLLRHSALRSYGWLYPSSRGP